MPKTTRKEFKAKLQGMGPKSAWTYLEVPFDVEKTWGTRARLSVKGTMNGHAFRSSIFPDGKGRHHLMTNKAMLAGAKAATGDTVKMVMEPDAGPRTVTVPAALKKALAGHQQAKACFDGFSPSHKKAYVDWINEAKQEETRQRRVAQAVEMLEAGKKRM
jgi:hypothetical protein